MNDSPRVTDEKRREEEEAKVAEVRESIESLAEHPVGALKAYFQDTEPDRADLDRAKIAGRVVVETGHIHVSVGGILARIVTYLVTAPGLAGDLEDMTNGQLHITWGPGGPFKANAQKYYPEAKSSHLVDESS